MSAWKPYKPPPGIHGTAIPGSKKGLRSRRRILWLLRWLLWRTVIVFRIEIDKAKEGYRVGFHTIFGTTWISDAVFHNEYFRVLIGYEDCIFFAVSVGDKPTELPLAIVVRTGRGDRRYKHARLL